MAAVATTAPMKVYVEDIRDFVAEMQGGGARTELTIASGAIVPPDGAGGGVHTVDTEGNAASDDLTTITTTNTPIGRFMRLYAENAARVVTLKDSGGGAGQMLLADGNDFVFASIDAWVLFQLRSTDWIEVARYVPVDDLTAITSLATDDLLTVWDESANAYRRITQANALKPPTIEWLTSGTAATYNSQTGAKKLVVELWGGGGGSGGVDGQVGGSAVSGAGGGGAYCAVEIATPLSSYTYTVGAAGTAGASGNNNGVAGSATTFADGVSLTMSAGGGGLGAGHLGTAGSSATTGAAGGTASGGDVNLTGGDAGTKVVNAGVFGCIPTSGGAPVLGGGVRGTVTGAGVAGRVYGEGGGSASSNDATNYAGAAGAGGAIKITTYF